MIPVSDVKICKKNAVFAKFAAVSEKKFLPVAATVCNKPFNLLII